MLGNLPAKHRSRLKSIHLLMLSPASMISKYGYKEILQPLIDDLKKLETEGIIINFQGIDYKFKGTISMIVADNLAAHALGGFFCNFSTVDKYCRFCTYSKKGTPVDAKTRDLVLRTRQGYINNVSSIEQEILLSLLHTV